MAQAQASSQAALDQWLAACAKVFPPEPQPVKQPALDAEQYAESGW